MSPSLCLMGESTEQSKRQVAENEHRNLRYPPQPLIIRQKCLATANSGGGDLKRIWSPKTVARPEICGAQGGRNINRLQPEVSPVKEKIAVCAL